MTLLARGQSVLVPLGPRVSSVDTMGGHFALNVQQLRRLITILLCRHAAC